MGGYPFGTTGEYQSESNDRSCVSMALLKPIYLYLLRYDAAQQPYASFETYTIANQELFLNRNRILGADRCSNGLN